MSLIQKDLEDVRRALDNASIAVDNALELLNEAKKELELAIECVYAPKLPIELE